VCVPSVCACTPGCTRLAGLYASLGFRNRPQADLISAALLSAAAAAAAAAVSLCVQASPLAPLGVQAVLDQDIGQEERQSLANLLEAGLMDDPGQRISLKAFIHHSYFKSVDERCLMMTATTSALSIATRQPNVRKSEVDAYTRHLEAKINVSLLMCAVQKQ